MKKFLSILFSSLCCLIGSAQVSVGIETLREQNFEPISGKRVGLVTNPTGVDRNLKSTIDILHEAENVNLVALFAPEHGVRGDVPAGSKVATATDAKTGVTVYSLYGSTRKPTPQMLKGLDILIYDIQDIGCRSYTFISTLGKLMEACIENNLPLMVLDRPNPLGGNRVEGPFGVDADCRSFVSQYSIPYVYGLTPGEFALYLNATEFGGKCTLEVLEMRGWERSMTFTDTGLPWVPTSPNIPTDDTVLYYPATGIMGELGLINIGANFTMPFKVALAENIDAETLASRLSALNLNGVKFRPCYMKINSKQLKGVQIYISEPETAELTMIQFYILQELAAMGQNILNLAEASRVDMFNKVCGSKQVKLTFLKRNKAADVRAMWADEADKWHTKVAPYLLY